MTESFGAYYRLLNAITCWLTVHLRESIIAIPLYEAICVCQPSPFLSFHHHHHVYTYLFPLTMLYSRRPM